ncbi:hypothetical protein D2V93_06935 [Flagellimonas taeanensis]|uniref:WapI family immunity protein n=1 Tax=Flavobacteriaceae TaxID=49546 RepID=UPI000E6A06F1|nr:MULTISPECIES: hypothetical protein [Allomuricauda]MDC6384608.1 hypothetical protein [Muricauda sp. SK9]RIV51633.1 hypothetical protein D2V93_06935 [Allomuricauda taeanensis]
MMFIIRDKNKQFRLTIIDYEYLTSEIVEDLNWLCISIFASDLKAEWSASGPYVRTFDLLEMQSWFLNMKEGKQIPKRLDFMEHELSFEYYEGKHEFSVNLDYDLHPKGKHYRMDTDSEYKIIFSLSEINIDSLLVSLESLVNKFPIRSFQSNSPTT